MRAPSDVMGEKNLPAFHSAQQIDETWKSGPGEEEEIDESILGKLPKDTFTSEDSQAHSVSLSVLARRNRRFRQTVTVTHPCRPQ